MSQLLDRIIEAIQRQLDGTAEPYTVSVVLQTRGRLEITGVYNREDHIERNVSIADQILRTNSLDRHQGIDRLIEDSVQYIRQHPITEPSHEQLYFQMVRAVRALNEMGLDNNTTRQMLAIAADAFYAVEKTRVASNPLIN